MAVQQGNAILYLSLTSFVTRVMLIRSLCQISLLLPWIERGAQMLERTALKTGEKLPQLTLAILHRAQFTNVKFAVLDLEHSTFDLA
jgi:hypothetical protein